MLYIIIIYIYIIRVSKKYQCFELIFEKKKIISPSTKYTKYKHTVLP